MFDFIKIIINYIIKKFDIYKIDDIDEIKKISCQILIKDNNKNIYNNLQDAEFKVFSQWGEDGIIQYLINKIPIENKYFVEFGVENYKESNTRFLLENSNWSGLVLDGSKDNIKEIKNSDLYWKFDLVAQCAFLTVENIDTIIKGYIVDSSIKNIGLLSIDIDGNDYFIWEAIKSIDPEIVICEYNWIFGNKCSVSVPYKNDFVRTSAHYSNLFFGASIQALFKLAESKGYTYVGCTQAGNDAFFVKKEIALNYIPELITTPEKTFNEQKAKESRDINGALTYIRGKERLKVIENMKVYDYDSGDDVEIKLLHNKGLL